MWLIDVNISQRFFISSILFLFFNICLIEKCEALEIKIEMFNFINDINILIYDKIIKSNCETLNQAHDIYTKWAWTHDVIFASEKYELMHFTCKLNRFNMMISIYIENSIIKLKSDVQVLEVQLNMKLRWNSHLHQVKANHVIRMLALSQLNVFTWEIIFIKTRQMYSTVVRLNMMFEALIWHQREKKSELSDREHRLKVLQNQTLHHVINVFKQTNIEMLKIETYISSIHVHLNKLQDQVTLCSWVDNKMLKTWCACNLIQTHLMRIN